MNPLADAATRVTEGVEHCACLDVANDPLARLAVNVGKLLPKGTWMDGHHFDCGDTFGMVAVLPTGTRRAVRLKPSVGMPSPRSLAAVLSAE